MSLQGGGQGKGGVPIVWKGSRVQNKEVWEKYSARRGIGGVKGMGRSLVPVSCDPVSRDSLLAHPL